MTDWAERIGRHVTADGSVVVPPRIAAWLEQKAGVTGERRRMLRDTDPVAYEVLAALRLASLQHSSAVGTKLAAAPTSSPHSKQWLTTAEAAAKAGVTDRAIRKWILAGKLPAERFGRSWRINPAHVHIRAVAA